MKRIFSIFLTVMIFSNLLSICAHAEHTQQLDIELQQPVLSDASSSVALDTVLDKKALASSLVEQAITCPASFDLSSFNIPLTNANLNAIVSLIYYEIPELFSVSGLVSYGYIGNKLTSITPTYRYTAEEYSTMLRDMIKNAEILLDGVKGNNNLSDLDKLLILHDRLAVWAEYDVDLSTGDPMYNAYGIFVNHEGVCMGYTLAYDYLLEQVGIDNYYCSSVSLNHAWNIVSLNGKWYHVDVTWDDPTYDKSGQVYHTNFLRSTSGIIATGHDATDFDRDPTDTTYDSYYWQEIDTPFQLIDNDIYFLDRASATINKLTDTGSTTIFSGLETSWYIKSMPGYYWPYCFSTLSSDGTSLFYSNSSAVYKLDVASGTSTLIWDLSSNNYEIYGFKWENCKLYCDMFNSPTFEETTKKDNQVSMTYHKEDASSKWIIDTFATATENGTTHRDCTGCGETITSTTTTTGVSCVAGATNPASIDYENKVVFLSKEMCKDISSIISDGNSTTSYAETSSSDYFGTGSKYNVEIGNEKVTFTVVVDGDLNGDSVCDVLDAAVAAIYSSGKKTPSPEEIYAANGEYSDTIDISAYQSIVNKSVA